MSTEDVLNRAEEVVLVPIGELIPHPKSRGPAPDHEKGRYLDPLEPPPDVW